MMEHIKLENPLTVFERWALPPARGVKKGFEGNLRYGDAHLNAAHIGFMQCYNWLAPFIAGAESLKHEGLNTPDVISNDKKEGEFSKPILNRETTEHSDHEDDGLAMDDLPIEIQQFVKGFGGVGYMVKNGQAFKWAGDKFVKEDVASSEEQKVELKAETKTLSLDDLFKLLLNEGCDCEKCREDNAKVAPKILEVKFDPTKYCVVPRDVHDAMNEFLKKVNLI